MVTQGIVQIATSRGEIRLQPQRLPEMPDGLLPVSLHHQSHPQVVVGLGVIRSALQREFELLNGLGETARRRRAIP